MTNPIISTDLVLLDAHAGADKHHQAARAGVTSE